MTRRNFFEIILVVVVIAAVFLIAFLGLDLGDRIPGITRASAIVLDDPIPPLIKETSRTEKPFSSVPGVLLFRGSPQRTGNFPGELSAVAPSVAWRYPKTAMCSTSSFQGEAKTWCGSGWTGQPSAWVRPNGVTEIVFGAFDKSIHFINAETGIDVRPPFKTGDIIKGSVSIDPDGYPLVYSGSRDNYFRIISVDQNNVAKELWKLSAYDVKGIWNDDWDGNPLIIDDVLYQSGENSWFYAIELNRGYDENGHVTVNPKILAETPLFDKEWIAKVGDTTFSIESSPAYFDGRIYAANSAGRVVGFDVTKIKDGAMPIVFDFWTGDDVDASVVIDDKGMLYVASELERKNARSLEVGQIVKLDPYTDSDPIVWSVAVPAKNPKDSGGVWGTPALGSGMLYVPTHGGEFLAIDTTTGEVTWRADIGWHAWSSPAIVGGDTLLVGICTPKGGLWAYDISEPKQPKKIWQWDTPSGSCIESSPVVWEGGIYVGSRDGYFYKVR